MKEGVGPGPMFLEVRPKVPRYYPQQGDRRTHGINITWELRKLKILTQNQASNNPLKASHFLHGSGKIG